MEKKDTIYSSEISEIKPFEFNELVANVFDDMAQRSIPFYHEVQKMICELSLTFFRDKTNIYDLGCSTGTTAILLGNALSREGLQYTIHGLDSSKQMCEKAKKKIAESASEPSRIIIKEGNILEQNISNASVVVMNYTLQFIDPLHREDVIKTIYEGLNHNGILLVSNKTHQSHTDISRIFIDNYYGFKKLQGYSDLEIAQKRDALDNVLIPYSIKEETDLFKECGFSAVDIFFSWYNFTSYICIKR